MITSLYIIHETGPCLFKREYLKNVEIDEQLISGFLMAVSSFAQEAFVDGLQRIQLASGRRLIYGYNKEYGVLAAALSDNDDHPILVEKILDSIVNKFIERYGDSLRPFKGAVEFDDFKEVVDEEILKRVRVRDKVSYVSSIISSSMIAILEAVFMSTMRPMFPGLMSSALVAFLAAAVPSFFGGFIGGNRKIGVISGFAGTLPFLIIILISPFLGGFDQFIFYVQTLVPMALIMGALSGYLVERTRLYPLRLE